MVRTADHAERRRQIADAVQRLIADGGFDDVTVAKVAAGAQISVGLVQHYFARKDDMVLFAYQQVLADVRARVDTRIAAGEARQEPIRTMIFDGLCQLLPLDRGRRAQYRLSQVFWGRSLDDPALAQAAREMATGIRSDIARAVRNGKECGEVAVDVQVDVAALRISAVVDGLARPLYQHADTDASERALQRAVLAELEGCLAGIFTGHCRHHD